MKPDVKMKIIGSWTHIISKAKEAGKLRIEGHEDKAKEIINDIEAYAKICDEIILSDICGDNHESTR